MQRVYLDQNKWIDLARARVGHKEEAHLVEVLQAAQEAVRAGDASFPLSAQHYYETPHRGDRESREHLARTMLGLSQGDAIASAQVVVPYEIEVALIEQLQLPNDLPPAIQIFGKARITFSTQKCSLTRRLTPPSPGGASSRGYRHWLDDDGVWDTCRLAFL